MNKKGKEGALSHSCIGIFSNFSLRELIVVLELLDGNPRRNFQRLASVVRPSTLVSHFWKISHRFLHCTSVWLRFPSFGSWVLCEEADFY
jgi:hypothetical protein